MLMFYLSLLETQEDKDKLELLYDHYTPLLKHVAYQLLQDEHLAEDAVHTAFLNIIKSFCEIGEPFSHKTKRFLVVVTENAAIDMLRRDRPDIHVSFHDLEPVLALPSDMLEHVETRELAERIAALPEVYRSALELRAYHGLNEKQIAAVLGISHGAARKRIERARSLLAAALREKE